LISLALLIIVALIGILAGGLVNVLSDDLPERRNPRLPRYPDDTPRPVSAWLGITAFFTGQRASSPDSAKLSWRYPLTEIGTAAALVVTLLATADDGAMTGFQLFLWCVYMVILVLITVIDLEHKLILFVVMIPSMILAIADALLDPLTQYGPPLQDTLVGGALGFGISFLLYIGGFVFVYISSQLRGHDLNEVAFGFGDVMLFTFSGLILGPQSLLFAMFITVMVGAFGAVLFLAERKLNRAAEYRLFTALPYGPYIVFGTVCMLLFSNEILVLAGFR
jgi:leader peptidase (prepilin peptidase)/N-methyltransferase